MTNSIKNRDEMNSFVESFLKIIQEALEQMTAELKEKSRLLQMAYEKLRHEQLLNDEDCRTIMFVLAQNRFFDSAGGVTVKEIAEVLEKSEVTTRKHLRKLAALSRMLKPNNGSRIETSCNTTTKPITGIP